MDSSSVWTGTLATAVTAGYAAMQTAMIGLTHGTTTLLSEVSVSYTDKVENPVAPYRRAVPLVLTVGGATALTHIATQRRRLGR